MYTGIQISSLKPLLTDYENVLLIMRRLREIGFRHVQLQWFNESISPQEIASAVRETGFIPLGTQEKYDECIRRLDYFIDVNRACGCDEVCISGIPERFEGIDGIRKYIGEMKNHIEKIKNAGMRTSFHAVFSDFRKIDGEYAVEILLREIPELEYVPDTNPLVKSGINVSEWLLKYKGRMRMIHFKDMESISPNAKLMPVGDGCTDFAMFMPAIRKSGIEHLLVEQETWEGDPLECMERGFRFTEKLI